MSSDVWWTVLAAIMMFVGLVGVVVPILPGLLVVLVSAVVYGFIVGFGPLGLAVVALHVALFGVSLAAGILLPKKEAALAGASKMSQWGGLAGAVFGFFLIPVVGIIIGALAGVLVVEYVNKEDWPAAWVATKGVAKGFGKSVLVDYGLGLVMVGAWSIWALTVLF